jgi:uncharacterized protein YcnI
MSWIEEDSMRIQFVRLCSVVGLALLVPAAAQAHVSIWPRESAQGATERYTVRVPTEGKVTTVGADLEVPAGVVVEVKRQGERIVGISWKMDIKPGEFMEFGFVARNPHEGSQLVWTLRQRFADGTVTDWTNGPQGIRPTAVTKLAPINRTN